MTVESETFVPLMKRSKGFEELKKLIIDTGICSACSTCAAFCERIDMDEDGLPKLVKDCNIEVGAIKCSIEGTCFDNCPMVSFSIADLENDIFGARRKEDALGVYKKIVAVRSKDKAILKKAQDGGAVTSILLFAIEEGYIDGAVVANRSKDWVPSAVVAKSKKDLLGSMGTKYARAPSSKLFGNSLRGVRKIALVGTGCQITGARKTQTNILKDVLEKTRESENPMGLYFIGLFCFENFPYRCIKEKIESEFKVRIEDVVKTDITKGKFIIFKKDGTQDQRPVKDFNDCVSEACQMCTNFTADFSDLSVGSVGTEAGWSTVIVRSEKGLELLEGAEKKGYIETSNKVDLDPIKKNFSLKEKKRDAVIEKRKKEGVYVPDYGD